MARNSTRKPKKDRTDEPDPGLLAHVRSLGLATVEDYLGWCARHGFGRRARSWLRPVAEWEPQTHNTRRQFASLARHLFAEWPVPAFMDSVWFSGNGREAARQQGWFLHVGRGRNVRTADLPLPYT